jgi:hypothetical protein
MNEAKAKAILYDYTTPDGKLRGAGLEWPDNNGDVSIDGSFSVEFLEAMLWWVKNKPVGTL